MTVKLRPWSISDLDSLVNHANNLNIAKNMTDKFPHPYTENDGREFLELTKAENSTLTFAIDIEGQAIGAIGIYPQLDIYRKNGELGYWLSEEFWGQGIISNAIKQIVELTFAKSEIDRVFAKPFGTNLASQRVLEKNGFILEGRFEKVLFKNGEYLDEFIYGLRRKTH